MRCLGSFCPASRFYCQLCRGDQFTDRSIKLNTTVMSFFDLDWLDRSATGLICEACGYVHFFARKGVVEKVDD